MKGASATQNGNGSTMANSAEPARNSWNATGPVLFTLLTQFTDLTGGMARHLRDVHGMSSALMHVGPLPDPKVYDLDASDFLETIDYQPVLAPRSEADMPSPGTLAASAVEVERRYGVRLIEMIRADRHLGQKYSNGAAEPTSSFGHMFTYPASIDLVLRLLDYFEGVVARLRPSMIVTAPADLSRMALMAVASAHNIPLRIPSQNHSNNALQWRVNRYFWPGGLAQAFESEVARGGDPTPEDVPVPVVEDSHRTEYARRGIRAGMSFAVLADSVARVIKRRLGDIVKRRERIYGGYRLGDQIFTIIAVWRERRRLMSRKPVGEQVADGQPYIFFPLVVEPETTLQSESPMADNQLTIIDWLAKSIPGGWRLVVKEHPGFTYPRPKAFWAQLRRYPNVDIAAVYESGEKFAQEARIVAVINGTLGTQAASAGIPVLTFNTCWFGRFLPHVGYAASYEEVAESVRYLADDANLPPVAERRRLGRALERALDVNSIPLEDPRILNEKALAEPCPPRDIENIVKALLDSLSGPASDAAIPFANARVASPTVEVDRQESKAS